MLRRCLNRSYSSLSLRSSLVSPSFSSFRRTNLLRSSPLFRRLATVPTKATNPGFVASLVRPLNKSAIAAATATAALFWFWSDRNSSNTSSSSSSSRLPSVSSTPSTSSSTISDDDQQQLAADANVERDLGTPMIGKELQFSPGVFDAWHDTSLSLFSRVSIVAHNLWARTFRLLQLGVLFTPAVLASPLLLLPWARAHELVYELLLKSMEWGGATICKLGQWASHRQDMLPPELCDILKRLRQSAPAHSGSTSRAILAREFCANGEAWPFATFDDEPIASGTVGQVHRAVLHNGQTVAVKILHPNVEDQLELDIALLFGLADYASKLPGLDWLKVPVGVHEFAATLRQQADLRVEAENLQQFARNFAERDLAVHFPTVVPNLVSKEAMVMSWEDGVSLQQYIDEASPERKHRMATLGFEVFMSMLVIDNFVHVDSHAGNTLVQPKQCCVARRNLKPSHPNGPPSSLQSVTRDSDGASLVSIDAGMVASLSPAGRKHLLSLLMDIVKSDGAHAAEMCIQLSRGGCPSSERETNFRRRCAELFDREIRQRKVAQRPINVHELLFGIMCLVREAHLVLDSEFATILVSMETQESVARALQPDIDLVAKLVPFLFANPKAALKFWLEDKFPNLQPQQ